MITDKNKAQIINSYFKGELDEETKQLFLKKYEEEEAFRNEVDEFNIIKNTFQNLSEDSVLKIESYLNEKSKEASGSARTIRLRNFRTTFAIAASITLLISLSIYYTNQKNKAGIQGIAHTQIRVIPVYQPENLGFTPNMGSVTDSLIVIIKTDKNMDSYYQYRDTLTLYFNPERKQPGSLTLKKLDGLYILSMDSLDYPLKQGLIKPQKLEIMED